MCCQNSFDKLLEVKYLELMFFNMLSLHRSVINIVRSRANLPQQGQKVF